MSSMTGAGREIEVTRSDKIFFPADSITKGEVVSYYDKIAERMLEIIRDRPIVMHRFPDGVDGEDFFHKNMPDYFPDWISSIELPKTDGSVRYVVAEEPATLVYLANAGTIAFHYLLASVDNPNQPAEMIFDLDPPKDADGSLVAFAARRIREALTAIDMPAYANSTGSRGLHIHVPLEPGVTFEQTRALSGSLAAQIAERFPDRLTTEQRKDKRRGRLFIDTLRNSYGQHAIVPYSLRALPHAPIAIPLDWREATSSRFDPRRITLTNVFRRLSHKEDPWSAMHATPGATH